MPRGTGTSRSRARRRRPPAQASYSSDSVKRRRVDDRAREALRREESRLARGGNVRRAAAVWGDDLARGLLERELGLGSRVAGDVGAAGWAAGAGSLGRLGMAGVEGGGDAMGCFWVGTPRGMDVGVAVVRESVLFFWIPPFPSPSHTLPHHLPLFWNGRSVRTGKSGVLIVRSHGE